MRLHRRSALPARTPALAALRLAGVLALIVFSIGCEESSGDRCDARASGGAAVDTPSPTLELPPAETGVPFLQGTSFDPIHEVPVLQP